VSVFMSENLLAFDGHSTVAIICLRFLVSFEID